MDGQVIQRIYRRHPAQHGSARQSQEHPTQEHPETENLHWRPARQVAPTRTVPRQAEDLHRRPQRRPVHTPTSHRSRSAQRRKPQVRARWGRLLLLLALIVPGLTWLYVQAPRLLPFTARHGAHPGLLLLAVVALVVAGGLKQVVWFKTMQRVAPPLSEE